MTKSALNANDEKLKAVVLSYQQAPANVKERKRALLRVCQVDLQVNLLTAIFIPNSKRKRKFLLFQGSACLFQGVPLSAYQQIIMFIQNNFH